jgi:hypothetical protein
MPQPLVAQESLGKALLVATTTALVVAVLVEADQALLVLRLFLLGLAHLVEQALHPPLQDQPFNMLEAAGAAATTLLVVWVLQAVVTVALLPLLAAQLVWQTLEVAAVLVVVLEQAELRVLAALAALAS